MQEMPLDPSLAFTAQLELAPGLTQAEGEVWRAALLRDWYRQDAVRNFWDFARNWAARHPATGGPR